MKRPSISSLLCAVLIVIATIGVFGRVRAHQFLLEGDPEAVSENPLVQRGVSAAGLAQLFTGNSCEDSPLARLSHMLVVELFGPGPFPHHLTSVLLHAANAVLLFLVLRRWAGMLPALFAALGFALHPLQAASVLWVASRSALLGGGTLVLCAWLFWRSRRSARFARAALLPAGLLLLAIILLEPWHELPRNAAGLWLALPELARGAFWPSDVSPLPSSADATALRGFYLASLAIFLLAALAARALARRFPATRILGVVSGAALIVFWAAISIREASAWRDERSVAIRALELDPENATAHRRLAVDAFERGQLTAAADSLHRALELDPSEAPAHVLLGAIAMRHWHPALARFWAKLDEAEREFAMAIELDPRNAKAHALLGEVLYRRGAPESLARAAEHLRSAIARAPLGIRARTRLALVLAELQDPSGVREQAARALELDPSAREAWLALAQAAVQEGDHEEALRCYQKALELEPDYAEALTQLGTVHLERGELDQAHVLLKRAVYLHPLYSEALFQLARCLEALGESDEAARYYRLTLAQNAGHLRANLALAAIWIERGERAKARERVDAVLALYPDHPGARELLSRLEEGHEPEER